MPTPRKSPPRSDIGPVSDSSDLGETGRTPAAEADAASARKPRADSGDPALEPVAPELTGNQTLPETNAAISTNGEADRELQQTTTAAPAEAGKGPAPDASRRMAEGGEDEPRGVGKPWPALDYTQKHEAVEAELLERMRAKYGTTLVSDMDDAQQLLSYVTRNGLQEERKVSDDVIKNLIASREHMRAFTFNAEKEEADFRKSCGVIAKAAQPVTAVSLRDSLTTGPYWFSKTPLPLAEIACRWYRFLAILVLLILLTFQIYWTVCSSVLNKTDALLAEINSAPPSQYYFAQETARLSALKATNQQKAPAPTPAPTPPANAAESRADKSQLTLDQLVSKFGELQASYHMLRKLMFRAEPPPPEESAPKTMDDIFTPTRSQIETAATRTVAGQIVDVIQKWVLPLLYGALGAMVFVVRTLSVQARDRLFRKEALVSLLLRVFLGMISGLAIGWFWNQNPAGATATGALTATTLSPFALAFIAGYGVELFFALLDKIVSTFTNKA